MSAIINPDAIKVGDSLRSKRVGSKDWFVGEVVALKPGGVVLRDAERRRWSREWHEVEVLP